MHEIAVGSNVLADNDAAAMHNRNHFLEHGVYVVNLMSAPGAGKTTVLEKTVAALKDDLRMAVIEGDVQGSEDADRKAGICVIWDKAMPSEGDTVTVCGWLSEENGERVLRADSVE